MFENLQKTVLRRDVRIHFKLLLYLFLLFSFFQKFLNFLTDPVL